MGRLEAASFADDVGEIVRALRSALLDTLAAAGVGGRASDLAHGLGIGSALARKVRRLVDHPDLFEAARHAPGKAGMGRFLDAALGAGVPAATLATARAECERLQQAIGVHGGDRRTFDALLAGYSTADTERVELDQRRNAFTANSHLWGLQARAQVKTYVLHESTDGEAVDAVILAGFVELESLRRDTSWPVSRTYRLEGDGRAHPLSSEPLDPQATGELPVLRAFTTVAPESLRPVSGRGVVMGCQRVQAQVGRTGAVDFFTGEIVRGASAARCTESVRASAVHARLWTPCEVAILDVFVHRDLLDRGTPEARLYRGMFQGGVLSPLDEDDRLRLGEPVEPLGVGLMAVRSPVLAAYPSMLELACTRTGWDGRAFQGWRIAMRFPPTPAILTLHRALPA